MEVIKTIVLILSMDNKGALIALEIRSNSNINKRINLKLRKGEQLNEGNYLKSIYTQK